MQSLLTLIVMWLSTNFGLPAVYDHPQLEFASAAKMAQVRYSRLAELSPTDSRAEPVASATPDASGGTYAIYDDKTRTIYLPEGWSGTTPAELSMLVHEMVHHLQNLGGLRFECAQAREKTAYVAQEHWLGLFGRSLATEFQLDPGTLLLRTRCMF